MHNTFLKYAMVVGYLLSTVSILLSPLNYKFFIIVCTSLLSFFLVIFPDKIRVDKLQSVLINSVVYYVIFAVHSKIIIISNFPEMTLGSLTRFDIDFYKKDMFDAVLSFTIGIFAILVCLYFFGNFARKIRKINNRISDDGDINFIYICALAIILKYFLIENYDMAKPGVVPKDLQIPLLTGVLNTFSIHGVMIICTVAFILNFGKTSLLFMLLNIFLDLSNGYKFSLITTVIVLMIYKSIKDNFDIVRFLTGSKFSFIGILFLIFLYPAIDFYSDLVAISDVNLADVNILAIIFENIFEVDLTLIFLPFAEMIRRVNGLDSYIIMKYFSDLDGIPFSYIFNSTLIQDVNYGIYSGGAANVVSASGSTIFLPIFFGRNYFEGFVISFLLFFNSFFFMRLFSSGLKSKDLNLLFISFTPVELWRQIFSPGDYYSNFNLLVFYFGIFFLLDFLIRFFGNKKLI